MGVIAPVAEGNTGRTPTGPGKKNNPRTGSASTRSKLTVPSQGPLSVEPISSQPEKWTAESTLSNLNKEKRDEFEPRSNKLITGLTISQFAQ